MVKVLAYGEVVLVHVYCRIAFHFGHAVGNLDFCRFGEIASFSGHFKLARSAVGCEAAVFVYRTSSTYCICHISFGSVFKSEIVDHRHFVVDFAVDMVHVICDALEGG